MCTKNQILIKIYQVIYTFRSSFNTFGSFFHQSTNNYTITLQVTDTYPIFGRACSTSSKSPEGEGDMWSFPFRVPLQPVPGAGKTVHTYISATVENPETFASVVGSCAKFHGEKKRKKFPFWGFVNCLLCFFLVDVASFAGCFFVVVCCQVPGGCLFIYLRWMSFISWREDS